MSQFNLVNSKVLFPKKGRIEKRDVKVEDGSIGEIGDCSERRLIWSASRR